MAHQDKVALTLSGVDVFEVSTGHWKGFFYYRTPKGVNSGRLFASADDARRSLENDLALGENSPNAEGSF